MVAGMKSESDEVVGPGNNDVLTSELYKRTSVVLPQIFNILLKMYATNADKFDRMHQALTAVTLNTAPLFGKITVTDVKRIEVAKQEDFKAKFFDSTKTKATSDEGKVG